MPLFNLHKRRQNHSAPVASLAVGLINTRPQNSAADCLVGPHLPATYKSQYQARVAEPLDRDLERECAVKDWVPLSVCTGSAFCLHFVP